MKTKNWRFEDLEWIVINLPHRKDRLKDVTKELARIGVAEFIHFPAINGKEQKQIWPDGLHNTGQLGCLLSHIEVLKLIEKEGDTNKAYVVCEDDVVFVDKFKEELFPLLPFVDFTITTLHYVGANNLHGTRLRPINDRLWRAQGLYATHCYIVHPLTAGVVRQKLEQKHHYVDCLLVELQQERTLTCFDKPLALQRASYSDILNSEVHHEIKGWL